MSYIKTSMIVIFIVCFSMTTFSQTIVANGNILSEIRDIKGLNKIIVSGSVRIEIKQSESEMVEVTCDENILPYILTEQSGSTLTISRKGKLKKVKKMLVVVSLKELNSIVSHGSADIKSDGFLSGEDLSIEIQGQAILI